MIIEHIAILDLFIIIAGLKWDDAAPYIKAKLEIHLDAI